MKKLWLDVESTGLDPLQNTVIQIAAICDGEEFHAKLHTQPDTVIDSGALMVNSYLEDDDVVRQHPLIVAKDFLRFLKKYRTLNNGYQLTLCGHNVLFDLNFMNAFYNRFKISGFDKMFSYHVLDTMHLAIALKDKGILALNQKLSLSALCQTLGVKNEKAHDAMSDIRATKELYGKMLTYVRT